MSRLVTLRVDEVLAGAPPTAGAVLMEEEGWLDDGRPLVVDGHFVGAAGHERLSEARSPGGLIESWPVRERELAPPMRRAVELAWESFCAGSLGIGAVITRHGDVYATGRNRLGESDPGDDVLAGTSLAHAELNALAKVPWGTRSDGLELWTTLQPCLQCLGAIRLSPLRRVHVLAPDPLFRGVERARHLSEFIGREWPDILELPIGEWSVLSLLLQTHVAAFWQVDIPGWTGALPSIAVLARELVASGELIHLAADAVPLATVADVLWGRLGRCVEDVKQIASIGIGET